MLIEFTIEHRLWHWYQLLMTEYGFGNHCVGLTCEMDIAAFYAIATEAHKIAILQSQASLDVVQISWLMDIAWCRMSQPVINAVAANLMRRLNSDWLREAYQLGLTFDSDCVLRDPDAYFWRYLNLRVMTEPNDPIRALHPEFLEMFQELGMRTGCFTVCYLQAVVNQDLETIQNLQREMPTTVTAQALKLILWIADYRLFRFRENSFQRWPDAATSNQYGRRFYPTYAIDAIVQYLIDVLMSNSDWSGSELADQAAQATVETCHLYLMLTINWPHNVMCHLAQMQRQATVLRALYLHDRVTDGMSVDEWIKFIKRDSSEDMRQKYALMATREVPIPLESVCQPGYPDSIIAY